MNVSAAVRRIPCIQDIHRLARERSVGVWLVGGFLRDWHIRAAGNTRDFDFCVAKDVLAFTKEFCRRARSHYIVLDDEQKSYRAIVTKRAGVFSFDFTAMRGHSIEDDISLRDYTVNTLAVRLGARAGSLVDIRGGVYDIRRKRAQALSEQAFIDDPLRIMRGCTLMAKYGFTISTATQRWMAAHAGLLRHVSAERIAEEFFKILASPVSHKTIFLMDVLGILGAIIPCIEESRGVTQEGGYHHLDVWGHSREALRQFEILYERLRANTDIMAYLQEPLAGNRRRYQLLKIACLLHDIGKPRAKSAQGKKSTFYGHEKISRDMARAWAQELKLSCREIEALNRLVFWHMRPGQLADMEKLTPRAQYRFFRDCGDEAVSVILVSLSDWRATRGPKTNYYKRRRHERIMLALADEYFTRQQEDKPVPLVDGHDIMRHFSLLPGKIVGRILSVVHEAQAIGKIANKQEAYALAKKVIAKQKKVRVTG